MSKLKNVLPNPASPSVKPPTASHYWRLVVIGILLLSSLPYTVQAAAETRYQPLILAQQATDTDQATPPTRERKAPDPAQTPQPSGVSQPGRYVLTGNPITFSNSSVITINDAAAGTPYPSLITVTGITGTVSGMTARLNGLTHAYPEDIDLLLVGPGGQKTWLMSDAGGLSSPSNVTLTFDDNATSSLSTNAMASGTYKPTDYATDSCPVNDAMPAPAPSGPYSVTLSAFSGLDVNTAWQLYGRDDCAFGAGTIARGWSVTFYVNQAAVGSYSGTNQTAAINTSFAQPLQAIVNDAAGAPMSGVVVTFTAPLNGASGTFAGGSNIYSGTTDANGLITATTFTANLTRGSYEVVASAQGINVPTSFLLTNATGAAAQVGVVSGNNQSAILNAAFANRLVASASDISNNPVGSGTVITFTAPSSGPSGKFSNNTNVYAGTTNSSGQVTAQAFTANGILGTYVVTATISGVITPATFTLTNTTPTINVYSGSGQGATISTTFGLPLVALVTAGTTNTPVSSAVVTFTAPIGGATGLFANNSNVYVGTTNSLGQVTTSAFTANGTTGSYSVTATVANTLADANFVLTNTAPSNIQFASSAYTVSEGIGTAVFTLTRTGGNGGAVTANVITSNLTADNADYSPVSSGSGLDTTFDPGTGTPGEIYKSIVLSDGKSLLAGNFATYNGQNVGRVARLNADGSLDTTFLSTGAGADRTIHGMTQQPDGKIIIVGGDFTTYNGVARNRIARLNSDGSLDTSFVITGTGPNNSIFRSAVQPDGKIIIGGDFITFNGLTRNRIARLNSDGGIDDTFTPTGLGANSTVWAIAVQPDGKIVIGGTFTSYAGSTRNRIARLNADGSLDATFIPISTGVNSTIWAMTLQPDGKIIISGDFTTYNGVAKNNIARLNTDGSLDTAYPGGGVGANESIRALDWQTDGKLIIGGSFTQFNQQRAIRLARLNTDGSLDSSFLSTGAGPSSLLWTVAAQPNNRILVGGDLLTFDGVSRNHIARAGGFSAYWADGDTSPKTISVTLTDDNLVELNEQFTLAISSVNNGAVVGSPASTTVTILDNEPTSIGAVSGGGQSTAINTSFPLPLVASVLDANNNPVSGQVVTFTAPASGASGTFTNSSTVYTGTTGSSGLVTTSIFTANGVTGTYTVTALVAGVITPANFMLTNTCNPLLVNSTLDNGTCGTLRNAVTAATNGQTITITLTPGSVINLTSGLTLGAGVNLTTTAGCSVPPPVILQAAGPNAGTGLRLSGNNNVSNLWVRGFSDKQIVTLGVANKVQCTRASRT